MSKVLKCYDAFQEALSGLLTKSPYYYYFTNQSPYGEDESGRVDIAAIELVINTVKMRLLLNPKTFPPFDLWGRMFIVAHEIIHVIRLHPFGPYIKHELWNLAIDLDVNTTLLAQGMKLPCDPEDPSRTIGITCASVATQVEAMWLARGVQKSIPAPPGERGALWYFNWLLANVPKEAQQPDPKNEPGNTQGKGSEKGDDKQDKKDLSKPKGNEGPGDDEEEPDNDGGDSESDEGEDTDNGEDELGDSGAEGDPTKDDKSGKPSSGSGKGKPTPRDIMEELLAQHEHEWPELTPEEQEIVKQVVADQAQAACAMASPPGNLAGSVHELIESRKPQENWERKIAKFTGMLGGLDGRTTMARYNKYGGVPRYVFRPSKKLLVMVDTSGSMTPGWIGRALGAIEAIAKHCEVDVMWIDCQVHEIISFAEARRRARKGDTQGNKGYQVKGRGGTSMRIGFRYVQEKKLKYDGRLVFSDLELYDGFPTAAERGCIPTLWVGLKGDAQSHPVPREAGPVIYIPTGYFEAAA